MASDLRDLWFHTHLQIRLADDTNSTSHTLKIIWSTFLLSIRCIAALAKSSILFKDFFGVKVARRHLVFEGNLIN